MDPDYRNNMPSELHEFAEAHNAISERSATGCHAEARQ